MNDEQSKYLEENLSKEEYLRVLIDEVKELQEKWKLKVEEDKEISVGEAIRRLNKQRELLGE